MGPFVVSLLFTIGASTWLYNKFMRYTGNIAQRALTATAVSGLVIFVISYIIFRSLLH